MPQMFSLFQDTGPRIEMFCPERPKWLGLLYASKQLHNEFGAELYRSNWFNLVDTLQHQFRLLQSFLSTIGSVNAGSLTRLCICFPAIETTEGQPGNIVLRSNDLLSLKLLQLKCTGLTTLKFCVQRHNYDALAKIEEDKPQFIREALMHINAQLKSIPSLTRIIVRIFSDTPAPLAMDLMHGFGWVVLRGVQEQ